MRDLLFTNLLALCNGQGRVSGDEKERRQNAKSRRREGASKDTVAKASAVRSGNRKRIRGESLYQCHPTGADWRQMGPIGSERGKSSSMKGEKERMLDKSKVLD